VTKAQYDLIYHRLHRDRILDRKRRVYWNRPGERDRILAIRKVHDKVKRLERYRNLKWRGAADAMIEDAMNG
jgi:hypothetical protein